MFKHSVSNYYAVTFVLGEAGLKISIDPVPERQKFIYMYIYVCVYLCVYIYI